MKFSAVAGSLALAAGASAQRPSDVSICDYYTTALLKENNATNQQTLLTLVVNTAVIGNYTKPNVGIAVPGILAPGTGKYDGVNLLPYFTGALASTNNGGSSGVSVNFLDGGGAAPLKENLPANSTNSAQYFLLTHLYQYFGGLLGCSQFANTTMKYEGHTSMYSVHKYMALDSSELGWFIQNVGLAAASFGVADADVTIVGNALVGAFDYKCSPPVSIPAYAAPELQSICIADDCMLAANATCAAYAPVVEPTAVGSMTTPSRPSSTGNMTSSHTTSVASTPAASASPSVVPYKGDAAVVGFSAAVGFFGLAAFLL